MACEELMGRRQPRDRRRHWGITQSLVLLIVIVLTPFILLEIYRGVQDVQRRSDTVTQQAVSQAASASAAVDDYLSFTERFLASLAGAPAVRALDGPGADALFQSVRAQNPSFDNIFLVSNTGAQRASTEPSVSDPNITQRPYFQQALSGGRMAISDVLAARGTGHSAVVLAYPVTAADGSSLGVLALVLDIARLSTVIGYNQLPVGSVVLLAQENGAIIAASTDPTTWVGQSLVGFGPFQAGVERQATGTTEGRMLDQVRRVVGFRSIARAPWIAVAGIPRAEVSAEAGRSLTRVSEEIALAALVTIVLGWIMLRRVVAPIRVLDAGASALAAGQFDHRIPLRRQDELGDLSDALNGMAAALSQRLEEEAAHAEALLNLNRRQTEFVATASHELRTPITAIRSYAEALLRPDIADEAIRRECLAGITRSSARLARLVQTLLDVSRIDSGNISVYVTAVDAAAVARAVVTHVVTQTGRSVTIAAPADLPPVLADADLLEDALANLVDNAVKFSPQGTQVCTTLLCQGSRLTISVQDLGEGIAPEDLARIFDRFYQIQTDMARRTRGAGLGLYIARGYIAAMGGQLWAESNPAQGSRFVISLPALVEDDVQHEEAEISHASAT